MGIFSSIMSKASAVETTVVNEVRSIVTTVESDVKSVFAKARQDAIDANNEVTRLKGELQAALVKSRDLHQAAASAAEAAAKAAEADAAKFKQAISAHLADLKTQASQIITQPKPVAEEIAPTVDTSSN